MMMLPMLATITAFLLVIYMDISTPFNTTIAILSYSIRPIIVRPEILTSDPKIASRDRTLLNILPVAYVKVHMSFHY